MGRKISRFYTADCKGKEFYLRDWNIDDFSYSFIKHVVQDVTFDGEHVRFKCLKEDKDTVEFCFPAEIFEVTKTWKRGKVIFDDKKT